VPTDHVCSIVLSWPWQSLRFISKAANYDPSLDVFEDDAESLVSIFWTLDTMTQ
jgi:nitrogen-specific signal transduction histidine kinase